MVRSLRLSVLIVVSAVTLVAVEPTSSAPAASAPLSPMLYCTQGYSRKTVVDLRTLGPDAVPAVGISVRVSPMDRFIANVRVVNESQLELRVNAQGPGAGTLELLGAKQTVLRRYRVQEVSLTTNVREAIGSVGSLPDGSAIFGGEMILRPYVTGLDIRFICLSREVTVTDGLGERWMASESFTPTPSTGNGITSFRMVRAPHAEWVPFSCMLYQDGEQIESP